jgi:hypothetical protein
MQTSQPIIQAGQELIAGIDGNPLLAGIPPFHCHVLEAWLCHHKFCAKKTRIAGFYFGSADDDG